jgi:type II secretion system protein
MITPALIFVCTLITLMTGCLAAIIIGSHTSRTSEIEHGLGAMSENGRRPLEVLAGKYNSLFFNLPLRKRLSRAGLRWSALSTELALGCAMLVMYLGCRHFIGSIAGMVMAVFIPFFFFRWLQRKAMQRTEQFVDQLPEISRILSNATSAGMSIERALALASRESPDPGQTELQRVVAHLSLGRSLDYAMNSLSDRMPSRELNILVRTIIIQSRSGGALVSALQDIARALEDRKQLRREVRTAVLSASVSGYIVPFIGIAAVLLINAMKPGVLDEMARTTFGQIILVSSLFFIVTGVLLMRLFSRIEV